jgi:hypothetical protein
MSDKTVDEQTGEVVSSMERFERPVMNAIQATALSKETGINRALFVPQSYGEAIEMAKMMCAGVGVPVYLRGSPANCMAILMQASRWGLDPYAVASDSYCVNDIIAYGAKLVNAVVTTSGALHGRLKIWWEGEGLNMRCFVEGHIKGDDERKLLSQSIARVKTKKSPLWEVNPQQQLAYFTTRAWARLYIPEVLLGVYSADEVVDGAVPAALVSARDTRPAAGPAPTAPRRSDFGAETTDQPDEEAHPAHRDPEKPAQAETAKTAPEREVGEPPEGFDAWEAWEASIASKMKVSFTIAKLDGVTAAARDAFDIAPDDVRERLTALYDEKITDHREAMK